MPTNKNASYRYRVIDHCLQNSARTWTLEDLIEVISEKLEEDFGITQGVSKRTVQNDINIMRSLYPRGFEAPIICRDGCYFYEDPNYSINTSPLNEKDVTNLQEAVDIFRQFKSIPVFDEINAMILKLEGKLATGEKGLRNIIQFEKNEFVKGIELIKSIYDHIKNLKVLRIDYQPFSSGEKLEMIIQPYLLKEYNNRWFLIGFNEELNKMSHLALDRILRIHKTGSCFSYPNDFDAEKYFKHTIGITIPENPESTLILLNFSPERAPYIITKPIHPSQKIIKNDKKGLTIQMKLIPNKEFMSLLLSFGPDVEIIEPQSLRREINEILKMAQEKNA